MFVESIEIIIVTNKILNIEKFRNKKILLLKIRLNLIEFLNGVSKK